MTSAAEERFVRLVASAAVDVIRSGDAVAATERSIRDHNVHGVFAPFERQLEDVMQAQARQLAVQMAEQMYQDRWSEESIRRLDEQKLQALQDELKAAMDRVKNAKVILNKRALTLCHICVTDKIDTALACGHVYCEACVTKFYNGRNASCPLCARCIYGSEITRVIV
jgi:hypothetical protein